MDPTPIIAWLVDQALVAAPIEGILVGCAERINAGGLPLIRAHISSTTLHPQFEAVSRTWHRDGGAEAVGHVHGASLDEPWQRSPLYPLTQGNIGRVRHHLEAENTQDYPVLEDFRALGGTDYLALATPWGHDGRLPEKIKVGMLSSWVTDRPGGFRDGEIEALESVQRALASAVRISLNMEIAKTVMATYLGADAGRRVLDGEIRRGDVQIINAAILLTDLRGFTALSDRMPRHDLVPMLDDYLEAMAGPVEANGGQILKFLGDGLLATFALDDGSPPIICAAAMVAAQHALDGVAKLNASRAAAGEPTMALDIAMHVGDVLYGNVGARNRLDFTVVGPAVNEAARIETLCTDLDQHLLISRSFVEAAGAPDRFRSLGRHGLRGVREQQELFTLRD